MQEENNKGFTSEEMNINYKTLKKLVIDVINHREADRQNLPNDFTILYYQTEKQPMFKFDKKIIVDAIMESLDIERFSDEHSTYEWQHIEGLLNEHFDINFDELNKKILKFNYATQESFILSKSDILKIINS